MVLYMNIDIILIQITTPKWHGRIMIINEVFTKILGQFGIGYYCDIL